MIAHKIQKGRPRDCVGRNRPLRRASRPGRRRRISCASAVRGRRLRAGRAQTSGSGSRKPRWSAPASSRNGWRAPSSPKGTAPRASCAAAWCAGRRNRPSDLRQLRIDRLLARRRFGIPLMLALLGVVLYLTLSGANVPSAWLSETLWRL